jgi:drug/metabolite transporter (DMT)-like permease
VAIAIRRMSMTESAETLTLYQMSIMTLCTAGLLTLGFRAPRLGDALMLALAGVGNGIAQFWWTRSLSLAPPSAVVPFNYLSLGEVAPFQWTVCQLAVYVLVMAACMSAS